MINCNFKKRSFNEALFNEDLASQRAFNEGLASQRAFNEGLASQRAFNEGLASQQKDIDLERLVHEKADKEINKRMQILEKSQRLRYPSIISERLRKETNIKIESSVESPTFIIWMNLKNSKLYNNRNNKPDLLNNYLRNVQKLVAEEKIWNTCSLIKRIELNKKFKFFINNIFQEGKKVKAISKAEGTMGIRKKAYETENTQIIKNSILDLINFYNDNKIAGILTQRERIYNLFFRSFFLDFDYCARASYYEKDLKLLDSFSFISKYTRSLIKLTDMFFFTEPNTFLSLITRASCLFKIDRKNTEIIDRRTASSRTITIQSWTKDKDRVSNFYMQIDSSCNKSVCLIIIHQKHNRLTKRIKWTTNLGVQWSYQSIENFKIDPFYKSIQKKEDNAFILIRLQDKYDKTGMHLSINLFEEEESPNIERKNTRQGC